MLKIGINGFGRIGVSVNASQSHTHENRWMIVISNALVIPSFL